MGVELTRVLNSTSLPADAKKLVPGGNGIAAVMLGGIKFDGFESPSKMPFGGIQKLIEHDIPGGARVINAMGDFEKDIDFAGTLLGIDAAQRARSLDALRKAGGILTLTWADFSRNVVIKEFTADYTMRGQLIPFHIHLAVLPEARPPAPIDEIPQITSSLSLADDITQLTPALSELSPFLKSVIAEFPGLTPTITEINAIMEKIGPIKGIIDNTRAAAENTLDKFSNFNDKFSQLSTITAPTGSIGTDAASSLNKLTAASRVQALSSSASGNLGNAMSGMMFIGGGL